MTKLTTSRISDDAAPHREPRPSLASHPSNRCLPQLRYPQAPTRNTQPPLPVPQSNPPAPNPPQETITLPLLESAPPEHNRRAGEPRRRSTSPRARQDRKRRPGAAGPRSGAAAPRDFTRRAVRATKGVGWRACDGGCVRGRRAVRLWTWRVGGRGGRCLAEGVGPARGPLAPGTSLGFGGGPR